MTGENKWEENDINFLSTYVYIYIIHVMYMHIFFTGELSCVPQTELCYS